MMGRTESNVALLSHAVIPASKMALVRAKNSWTSRSRLWWARRDTTWAKRSQWPGGSSDLGPSAQYSAITFWSRAGQRPALGRFPWLAFLLARCLRLLVFFDMGRITVAVAASPEPLGSLGCCGASRRDWWRGRPAVGCGHAR